MRSLITIIFCVCAGFANAAHGATGHWRTIDDASGEPRSVVQIEERDGILTGRIVDLIDPPEPDPICERCPGEKRNAPVQGLEILWGFEGSRRGGEWTGGELLDPENGRVYRGRLRVQEGGERLEVRGFVGAALFGRSQIWERFEAP